MCYGNDPNLSMDCHMARMLMPLLVGNAAICICAVRIRSSESLCNAVRFADGTVTGFTI
jgi:hypothetical protein